MHMRIDNYKRANSTVSIIMQINKVRGGHCPWNSCSIEEISSKGATMQAFAALILEL